MEQTRFDNCQEDCWNTSQASVKEGEFDVQDRSKLVENFHSSTDGLPGSLEFSNLQAVCVFVETLRGSFVRCQDGGTCHLRTGQTTRRTQVWGLLTPKVPRGAHMISNAHRA